MSPASKLAFRTVSCDTDLFDLGSHPSKLSKPCNVHASCVVMIDESTVSSRRG